MSGKWSRLRDASPDAEEIVAEAVRSVFGLTRDDMTDDEALDRVMNPARNRYRLDILNVSHHSPLMRALHHATYVFEKRLYVELQRHYLRSEEDMNLRLLGLSHKMHVPSFASNGAYYADEHDRELFDVFTCIKNHCTIYEAGKLLSQNSERYLKSEKQMSELFEELRVLRMEIARRRRVPPYVIFHDTTLREIARSKPRTREELRHVYGVGDRKAEDLGEMVLAVVNHAK